MANYTDRNYEKALCCPGIATENSPIPRYVIGNLLFIWFETELILRSMLLLQMVETVLDIKCSTKRKLYAFEKYIIVNS